MEYYFSTFLETHRFSAVDCVVKIQMQEHLSLSTVVLVVFQ